MRADGDAPGLEQPASEAERLRGHALAVGFEDQDCLIAEEGQELGLTAPLPPEERHAGVLERASPAAGPPHSDPDGAPEGESGHQERPWADDGGIARARSPSYYAAPGR
eukprot:9453202-Alexandrium_andersonii.AAC.1